MTGAERAVLSTSQARDLCLSLQRAFVGRHALERVRAGEAAALAPDALRVALGLAWAEGDVALVGAVLASLAGDRIAADPVLSAFLDVTRDALAPGLSLGRAVVDPDLISGDAGGSSAPMTVLGS